MKIIVFGANGMLGNYVVKYFKDFYEVLAITRADFDLANVTRQSIKEYISSKLDEEDVIVNCAGIIKQRKYKIIDMINVNSVFPNLLAELPFRTIHITTDCVYSGLIGGYNEDSKSDCSDDYGQTKSLGENPELTIIRTSIIGEELQNKLSLIEWVKSNRGGEIKGFTNHLWNGVTCLELAKLIQIMINQNNLWKGVRHVFSPHTYVSKYDLVSMINEIYSLGIKINAYEAASKCYRNLSTKYTNPITKTLMDQIKDLKEFKIV